MAGTFSDYPDFDTMRRRVALMVMHADALHELVFRCCEPAYATEDVLLSGEGSRKHGGRWNPPSSFASAYAAFSDVTALAEAKANHLYYGLDPADALPRTIVAVDVKLVKVIDFTDGAIRKAFGVSATRMRNDDWRKSNSLGAESLTQAIGRAISETGLEGLITPACDEGRNLIWFSNNLGPGSKATIRHVDRLN